MSPHLSAFCKRLDLIRDGAPGMAFMTVIIALIIIIVVTTTTIIIIIFIFMIIIIVVVCFCHRPDISVMVDWT